MKVYTLRAQGVLVEGIEVPNGCIDLGQRPMDRKPLTIPIDPRARVVEGRLLEAPGRGALLLIRDQSGDFGSWHLQAAQPLERWDGMVATELIPNALDRILAAERVRARFPHRAPIGWYEFARGVSTPIAETVRPKTDLYGYVEEGGAFEIRRRGRLYGSPTVHRVECRNGELVVTDPRADALARRIAAARPS